jgi:hypothetical protein
VVSAEQLVTVSGGVKRIICHCHWMVSAEQFVTVFDGVKRTVFQWNCGVQVNQLVTVSDDVKRIVFHPHYVASVEQLVTVSDDIYATLCVAITVTAGVKRTVGHCIWWCQENSFVLIVTDRHQSKSWRIIWCCQDNRISPSLTDGVKRTVYHCSCWFQDNNLSPWPLVWREKFHYDP